MAESQLTRRPARAGGGQGGEKARLRVGAARDAAERDQTENGPPVDLFEYQAKSLGGWVMPDVARCAVRPGITRPDVAGCG
jgi:hypothetical protein